MRVKAIGAINTDELFQHFIEPEFSEHVFFEELPILGTMFFHSGSFTDLR